MSLLLAALAVTATCAPDPSLGAAAAPGRVRAYIAAINARDEAAVGRFLAPGATFSNPQVQGIPLADVMTQLIATPQAEPLEVIEASLEGERVLLRTRTPSGTTATAMVHLNGGCVRAFNQIR